MSKSNLGDIIYRNVTETEMAKTVRELRIERDAAKVAVDKANDRASFLDMTRSIYAQSAYQDAAAAERRLYVAESALCDACAGMGMIKAMFAQYTDVELRARGWLVEDMRQALAA